MESGGACLAFGDDVVLCHHFENLGVDSVGNGDGVEVLDGGHATEDGGGALEDRRHAATTNVLLKESGFEDEREELSDQAEKHIESGSLAHRGHVIVMVMAMGRREGGGR